MADRHVTPEQHRAAALIAQGWQRKRVAAEIGTTTKTLQRWSKREDFLALVRKGRGALLAETPTAEAVLTAALNATRKDGSPDWQTRITAARALMGPSATGPEAEASARETRIYLPPEDDGEADPA